MRTSKVKSMLAIAGIAVGSLFVVAPTASADWSQCGSRLCAWSGINGEGGLLVAIFSGKVNFGEGDNDQASSIMNGRPKQDGAFYENANLSGHRYCLGPDSKVDNVGDDWNDEISSAVVYDGTGFC